MNYKFWFSTANGDWNVFWQVGAFFGKISYLYIKRTSWDKLMIPDAATATQDFDVLRCNYITMKLASVVFTRTGVSDNFGSLVNRKTRKRALYE